MSLARKSSVVLVLLLLLVSCEKPTTEYPPRLAPGPRPAAGPPLLGNEGGNGGDLVTALNRGAWFLTETDAESSPFAGADPGERAIDVCLKVAPDFGVGDSDARGIVEGSFAAWGAYLRLQNISLRVGSKSYRPATRLTWVGCSEAPSLRILLGVSDAKLGADRAHFVDPIGYAWQTKRDEKTGWGAGYLWIAPPRSQSATFPRWGSADGKVSLANQAQLRQILLHEIGHVLGCDHVPGTIMRQDILSALESDPSGERYAARYQENLFRRNLVLGRIDGDRQLMLSRVCYGRNEEGDCTNEIETRALDEEGTSRPWLQDAALQLIFGSFRPRSIQFTMELCTRKDGSRRYRITYLGFPKVGTAPGEVRLSVELPDAPLSLRTGPEVFKMILGEHRVAFPAAGDDVLNGVLTLRGIPYNVLIQRSSETDGLSQVWITVEGHRLRLN